jgi:hypothetical protein
MAFTGCQKLRFWVAQRFQRCDQHSRISPALAAEVRRTSFSAACFSHATKTSISIHAPQRGESVVRTKTLQRRTKSSEARPPLRRPPLWEPPVWGRISTLPVERSSTPAHVARAPLPAKSRVRIWERRGDTAWGTTGDTYQALAVNQAAKTSLFRLTPRMGRQSTCKSPRRNSHRRCTFIFTL